MASQPSPLWLKIDLQKGTQGAASPVWASENPTGPAVTQECALGMLHEEQDDRVKLETLGRVGAAHRAVVSAPALPLATAAPCPQDGGVGGSCVGSTDRGERPHFLPVRLVCLPLHKPQFPHPGNGIVLTPEDQEGPEAMIVPGTRGIQEAGTAVVVMSVRAVIKG